MNNCGEKDGIPVSEVARLNRVIDLSWRIFFSKVASGRTPVNKESSMQLHYAATLKTVGELLCVLPGETFSIELESSCGGKNLDITCGFPGARAAVELKCFRKASNRAQDLDMYDVWADLVRLGDLVDFQVKRFICLTDDDRYPHGNHRGYSQTFSIAQGLKYQAGRVLTPLWVGRWKDRSRDKALVVPGDVVFDWVCQDGWYYLLLPL